MHMTRAYHLVAALPPAEADASPPEGRNHHGHHDDPKRADEEPSHALGPGAGGYSHIGPALGLGAGHWQVPGLRGGHHTADDFFACPSNVKDKIAVGIYGAGRQCFVEEIIRIVLAYRLPAGPGGFLKSVAELNGGTTGGLPSLAAEGASPPSRMTRQGARGRTGCAVRITRISFAVALPELHVAVSPEHGARNFQRDPDGLSLFNRHLAAA